MNDSGNVVLPELPSLSRLYVNAAAMAARRRLGGSTDAVRLPGEQHEVRSVRCDVETLTSFQHLLGEPATDVLPAGFVHALVFPVAMSVMGRDDFPLPLLGMIHLRNVIEQRFPVRFDEAVDITAGVRDLRGHRAGTQVDVVAEVRGTEDGSLRWNGTSTYLAKGVYLPGIDKVAPEQPRKDFVPPDPTALWQLGVETGRNYAAVSGDYNPIHLSLLSAKALGLPRSIAHGMYLASRALAGVGVPREVPFRWDVTFEAPVYLPATVALDITTENTDDGAWQQSAYVAWNPRSGRRHFTGVVAAL